MYKNYKEALTAHLKGELSPQDLDSLEVYFRVISEPAEDVYCIDEWYYDEDEDYDLIVSHNPVAVNQKDLFRNYSVKYLTGKHIDVINCEGHCLTKEEIQEIFWDMGN